MPEPLSPLQRMGRGALAGIRVLDLAGPLAAFGTKLLADMGADVIRIEPPEGDEFRRKGPFAGGLAHPETSVPFLVHNLNKRGVTLSLESEKGARLLRRLAAGAGVLVETAPPGWMAARGIGYEALSKLNPRLVYTAVTPFGQEGPHAHYRAGDLTCQAMGGALFLTGNPGERPVRGGASPAEKMAGYVSAVATSVALFHQVRTGQGQFVDVSAQDAIVAQNEASLVNYAFTGFVRQRGGWRYPTTTCPAGIYPTTDGYVSIVASKPHQWTGLRDWIGDERLMKDEYMVEATRFADRDYIDPVVVEWTKTMTKSVLFHEGQRRGVPIGQSMEPGESITDVHMRGYGYYAWAHHPMLGEYQVPGAPFPMTGTPWRFRRPAPLLGQHNAEIYGDIGVNSAELAALRREGVI